MISKNLLTLMTALVATLAVMSVKPLSARADTEVTPAGSEVKTIVEPRYDGKAFLALTARESYLFEGNTIKLQQLQTERLTNICHALGYGAPVLSSIRFWRRPSTALVADTKGNITGQSVDVEETYRWVWDSGIEGIGHGTLYKTTWGWGWFTKISCRIASPVAQ